MCTNYDFSALQRPRKRRDCLLQEKLTAGRKNI